MSSISAIRYGPSPIGWPLKSEVARSVTSVWASRCCGRIGSDVWRRNPPSGVGSVKRTTSVLTAVAVIPSHEPPSGPS